jgi:hypothetical protein
MGIGISLLLVAAGAVLIWAVHATVHGVDLVTLGWVLLIVGAIGVLVALLVGSAAGRRRGAVGP